MFYRTISLVTFLSLSLSGLSQSNLIVQEQFFQDVPQYRATFQYDAQGREVGAKYYSNTAAGVWGLHSSEEKKFDESGRQIFYSRSGWKYAYDSLYYYSELQTLYNEAAKISNEIATIISYASQSNEQKQKTEKEYRYTQSGCLSSIVNRTYFDSGGIHESIEFYESDNQCRPLLRTYGNDVSIWKYAPDNSYVESRYLIYDEDSTQITRATYINNLITEHIYLQQEKITYTYYENGKITEVNRFNNQESLWILYEQTLNTYNESNQLIKQETFVGPDVLNLPLLYQYSTTYEYNEFGSVKYMLSDWIDFNGVYSQTSATTITFRCDGKPISSISTDVRTNQSYSKIFYYYSSEASCEASSASVSIFPNPSSRFLKINTTEQLEDAVLKIYTTTGQLISEIKDTKNMTPIEVDLEHLIPGLYILKVESKNMAFTERFVKE